MRVVRTVVGILVFGFCFAIILFVVFPYVDRYFYGLRGLIIITFIGCAGGLAKGAMDFTESLHVAQWLTRRRHSENKVIRPPGIRLQALAEFLLSRKAYVTIFEPTLRDLQDEHFEALSEGRIWKARWVVLRGRISFWAAGIAYLNGTIVHWIVKLALPRSP